MIITIHQPQFLPWLGYFEKVARSDIFVLLDDVQFKKNEWQNRNLIKTSQGTQWLTVPTHYHFPEKINEVKIDNNFDWRKKHLHSFSVNYAKAKFFKEIYNEFSLIYSYKTDSLSDFNIAIVLKSLELLDIQTEIIRSSDLQISGTSNERLISICKELKADTYLAGKGGQNYIDESLFRASNIKLVYQDYVHPVYPQLHGEFAGSLSVIDLFFNCGIESRDILLSK
jgi:hypothetical protein